MKEKKGTSLNRDASMADIIAQLKKLSLFLGGHWRPLLLLPVIFGMLGLGFGVFFHTDKKKAEFIIAAEEQGASGMDGLLAQFGLDVGGSNPGGGEAMPEDLRTRGPEGLRAALGRYAMTSHPLPWVGRSLR